MSGYRLSAEDGYHAWPDYSGPNSRCEACGLWYARWSGDPCPKTLSGQVAALHDAGAEFWGAIVAVTRLERLAGWLSRLLTRQGSAR